MTAKQSQLLLEQAEGAKRQTKKPWRCLIGIHRDYVDLNRSTLLTPFVFCVRCGREYIDYSTPMG